MIRNLDMTSLRSFLAVAETGGVTRAAGFLNLTQSAVSMQLKRLEESLGIALLDRSGRGVTPTPAGEQLLSYARRIVALNDEACGRMTASDYEGEITLGVPHDIVSPAIAPVLRRFAAACPRVRVNLISSFTRSLKEDFARGAIDLILTTEKGVDTGGETLCERQLIWMGAPDGEAWRRHPLPLAFEGECIFRAAVHKALDEAGIPWTMAVESNSTRSVEAAVSADLAIHAMLDGTIPAPCVPVAHGGVLPALGVSRINLYMGRNSRAQGPVADELAQLLRASFRVPPEARRDPQTETRRDPSAHSLVVATG